MFADGRRLDRRLLLKTRSPGVHLPSWPIGAELSGHRIGPRCQHVPALGLGCVKTRKIEKSREPSFSGKPKSVSLENVCATIDDFHRRFFCHYRVRLSFYTAWVRIGPLTTYASCRFAPNSNRMADLVTGRFRAKGDRQPLHCISFRHY
jgi:hypothetical protein